FRSWLAPPPNAAYAQAMEVLRELEAVDGFELAKHLHCLRIGGVWRGIEPRELEWVADPRGGEIEYERSEIRARDLRRSTREEVGVLVLRPEPIAHPRPETTRASAPLVGRSARDADGFEA